MATFVGIFINRVYNVPSWGTHSLAEASSKFVSHIFILCNLLNINSFNLDPKLPSNLWKSVISMLRTHLKMSASHHP